MDRNHFDNETLVQQSEFWKDLLKQKQRLKFHTIAVNYGRWETAQSRDRYAQTCHAHIHLLFDSNAWEEVKSMVSHEMISNLNARNYPGPNYLLKDCMELEQQRLQLAEHQYMSTGITKISETVENGNKTLIKLSETVENLSETVDSGNKYLIEAITSLTGAIKDLKKSNDQERN